MMGWMAPVRHLGARMVVGETHHRREPSMDEVTTIGLDLAKRVFQAHEVDAANPQCSAIAVHRRWRRLGADPRSAI
jgi:hypothetical protein